MPPSMSKPDVTVVIPTTGRPSLQVAIRSALAQVDADLEVVVVHDAPQPPLEDYPAEVVVLCTGGRLGGCAARNIGVGAARADLVAFLDDDDEWLPGKVRVQTAAAKQVLQADSQPIICSRVLQRHAGGDISSRHAPDHLIADGQRPEDYLFRGRRVSFGRPLLATSTILTTRELARAVPWDETLRRHQDWQWLLEAYCQPNVKLVQLPEATAVYTVGSQNSISASPDWAASLAWVGRHREHWDPHAYSDFLAAQVLRYAFQARDRSGVASVLREIRSAPVAPSATSVMSGLVGAVPRKFAERAAMALFALADRRQRDVAA